MISIRFITQMKKNSETRKGRYPSPSLPIIGRRIWSRTKKTPNSPRFCAPLGTSLGLANAAQKNQTTSPAQISASSIGLVKWKLPIEKRGGKRKLFRLGAGKPQPEKRWHPPPASA